MRKPTFCICENNDADQLCANRKADQRLCFHYIDSTIHLLPQGLHRPGKVLEFDLGPGKLLEFQNSAICPGIVLDFCKIALENVKLSLKIIKYTNSFPFSWIYSMRERKLCENCWIC